MIATASLPTSTGQARKGLEISWKSLKKQKL